MLMIQSTISPPVQKTLLVPAQIAASGKHGCYLALHGGFGSTSAYFHFPRRPIKRNSVQVLFLLCFLNIVIDKVGCSDGKRPSLSIKTL